MRIDLFGREGVREGSVLELHRTTDGAIRVHVHPGPDAGDPYPGGATSMVAFARALARKSSLRIDASEGYYCFQRDKERVEIEYHSTERESDRFWRATMSDMLAALKILGSQAA
ncbi:MAG TPA: hypothetical protein VG820_07620 [Fimbriimonadaceae bacterium]|nr:hypothetical protein [Fimbriimonadaceae bacterium]